MERTSPAARSWSTSASPSPSIFMARRAAKWRMDSRTLAGHEGLTQRETTSPSGLKIADPQTGQRDGQENGRSRPVRRSFMTETTRGMTSPLRSMRTWSPTRTSLRRISSSLCRVERLIVVPESLTGSSTATGVRAPVRPTWMMMSSTLVVAWRAGNLKEMAQRGNLAVTPRASRSAAELTLTTIPSAS